MARISGGQFDFEDSLISDKMHELASEGIINVEIIERRRADMPNEAIYLITPTLKNVKALVKDFQNENQPKYSAAQICFTESCHDDIFKILEKIPNQFVKDLKEVNMSFVPIESQVYSLEKANAFQWHYNQQYQSNENRPKTKEEQEKMAEQLATLCSSLGECPAIRYEAEACEEFSNMVKEKLELYKNNDQLGPNSDKSKSTLLILDRKFDIVSPILHEFTFQAMVYDLLPITNNVYTYEDTNSEGLTSKKQIILDENNQIWEELRHAFIAKVKGLLDARLDEALNLEKETKSAQRLREKIGKGAKLLDAKKNLAPFYNLAQHCIDRWDKLKVEIEQDLAVGEKTDNNEKSLAKIFLDEGLSYKDKVRVILLFILRNGPQTNEWYLSALNTHANVPENEQNMVRNLQLMDIDLYGEEDSKNKGALPVQKNWESDNAYRRWTPELKDLVKACIDGRLDPKKYPALGGQQLQATADSSSKRYGLKSNGGPTNQANKSRVIVFVMGGICYSECRVAYEVTQEKRNFEVIIGSSQIFTPEEFLNEVKTLTDPIPEEESCVIEIEDMPRRNTTTAIDETATTCNFLNPILHSIEKRFSRLRKVRLPRVHFSIRPGRSHREHDRVPAEELDKLEPV